MRNPHQFKHDAPIATAALMTPGTDLPEDFIGGHRNTYLHPVKHPDGERRDALMVIEPDLRDLGQPGVIILRYTAFTYTYGGLGRLGEAFATGTFPAPADADLTDDNLHCFAAHVIASPEVTAVPTVEQAVAMSAPGALTRQHVRDFPGYAYEVLGERLHNTLCAHDYCLTDSCPGCDVESSA